MASWGTLIIVIIQIYLLLHLRELSTRLKGEDHSFKAAWIGIYPDLIARTVSLLTTSFLPIAVLVYGIVKLGFSWLVFTTLGFGLALAVVTSILLWGLPKRRAI